MRCECDQNCIVYYNEKEVSCCCYTFNVDKKSYYPLRHKIARITEPALMLDQDFVQPLNTMAKWLALLLCILEVLGSNLGPEIGYTRVYNHFHG
jgi:hypothetical protein